MHFVKLLHTSCNHSLLSDQDKGSTPSLAHSLALPHGSGLHNHTNTFSAPSCFIKLARELARFIQLKRYKKKMSAPSLNLFHSFSFTAPCSLKTNNLLFYFHFLFCILKKLYMLYIWQIWTKNTVVSINLYIFANLHSCISRFLGCTYK